MARSLLIGICGISLMSLTGVPVPVHASDSRSANSGPVRLDLPARPAVVANRTAYTRIDPRQLAATGAPAQVHAPTAHRQMAALPTNTSAGPRPAGQPQQAPAVTRAPSQARPTSREAAAPVRTAARSPVPARALPQPQSVTATPSARPTQTRVAGTAAEAAVPEVALFPELAGLAPQDTAVEVAPWQKLGSPYEVNGIWFIPASEPDYDETGTASWYGPGFHGRRTANGELFDQSVATAAHPTLPIPSYVEVTNLDNGRSLVVRVNDRGPFAADRLIDLSARGAELLGFRESGTAQVRVRYVGPADQTALVTAGNLNPRPDNRVAAATPVRPATPRPAATQPAPPPRTAATQTRTPVSVPSTARLPAGQPANTTRPQGSREAAGTGTPATRPTAPVTGARGVQLGAFSSRANAERAARQAAPLGTAAIREVTSNGRTLFRVILEAGDETGAARAVDRARALGLTATLVQS